MSAPEAEAALAGTASIPRGADALVFPAPWAARAFAIAVALNERGVFSWQEWAETLSAAVAGETRADPADPETYWRAWLAALEEILGRKEVAAMGDLRGLREVWRHAAKATPHGRDIQLSAGSNAATTRKRAPRRGR